MTSLLKYASEKIAYLSAPSLCLGSPNEKLIHVSSALSSALTALSRDSEFKPPKLIVVGTQSSGKSSLLNALIGVQILPTGETMTTRAAIQVELMNSPDDTRVEFGTFVDGDWRTKQTLILHDPPTLEEHNAMHAYISSETRALLNGQGGVLTHTPISLRLHSKSVPNMSFVDLPGITMHALTSEGQPIDMCEQIRELIKSYIDDRTTILMVCAARPDLEADAAVELVMSMTSGRRTIGCLTKTDLCDSYDSILTHISGKNYSDLHVEHGYFAVRCRATDSEPMVNMYTCESAFFKSIPKYRTCNQERLGVLNLGSFVHSIIRKSINECLPTLRKELVMMRDAATLEYSTKLQFVIPENDQDKLTFINDIISRMVNQLKTIVTCRTPDASTGRLIRECFADLRESLRNTKPFEEITDDEIIQAVRNCEGWSMVAPIPPIEIVEFFMQHSEHRPIQKLMIPCMKCIDDVQSRLSTECKHICNVLFHRFSRLHEWVLGQYEILQEQQYTELKNMLTRILAMEEAYIFTDNVDFVREWTSVTECLTTTNYTSTLKTILTSYFTVVTNSIASQIPKMIVCNIKSMFLSLQSYLHINLQKVHDVSYLLFESEEIDVLRQRLTCTIKTSEKCLASIDEALAAC